jgi:KDO2-lipid IV(A) lauroyltransferase
MLNKINYILVRSIKALIEVMPVKLMLLAGRMLGRFAFLMLVKRRRITRSNLERAFPEKNQEWYKETSRKVFKNFGQNIMEFILFSKGKLFEVVDVQDMEKLKEGSLLLSGHLGNWEITGMCITASGRELFPVGRTIHSQALDKIVNDLRESFGGGMIHHSGAAKKLIKILKKKKSTYVLIDQRIKNGLPCRFFGRPVWCTHIISMLHRKLGVEVVPGYSYHEDGRIKVRYENPLNLVRDGDALKTDFINTQKQLTWLEEKIKERPEEWFWMHNFWKDSWLAVFMDISYVIDGFSGEYELKQDVLDQMRQNRKGGYLQIICIKDTEKYDRLLDRLEAEGVIVDKLIKFSGDNDDNKVRVVESVKEELNIELNKSLFITMDRLHFDVAKKLGISVADLSHKDITTTETVFEGAITW